MQVYLIVRSRLTQRSPTIETCCHGFFPFLSFFLQPSTSERGQDVGCYSILCILQTSHLISYDLYFPSSSSEWVRRGPLIIKLESNKGSRFNTIIYSNILT